MVLSENLPIGMCYATELASKLGIDYQYVLHILKSMVSKGWIKQHTGHIKKYYSLTSSAPLALAKQVLMDGVKCKNVKVLKGN